MKRIISIVVSIVALCVLTLSMSACSNGDAKEASGGGTEATQDSSQPSPAADTSSGGNSGAKKVIALCIAEGSNEFQSRIKDGMEKYIKDNGLEKDYEFTFQDAKFDTATQLQQVENMVSQGVDAIVMIAVDAKGSMACVEAANEANVPIIGCNTEVEDIDKLTAYVGSDSVESGRIEMEALAKLMGGKGKVVELQGTFGHEPQIMRNKGIHEILDKNTGIEVLADNTANWSRDEAVTVMENWLNADIGPQITAVVAHNDAMAVGAMAALEDAGRKDVLIAGIDANKDMLGYLKEGRVAVTVFQNALGQGEMAIEVAIKILNGEQYEKKTWIPYELVTPETADKYLALYE